MFAQISSFFSRGQRRIDIIVFCSQGEWLVEWLSDGEGIAFKHYILWCVFRTLLLRLKSPFVSCPNSAPQYNWRTCFFSNWEWTLLFTIDKQIEVTSVFNTLNIGSEVRWLLSITVKPDNSGGQTNHPCYSESMLYIIMTYDHGNRKLEVTQLDCFQVRFDWQLCRRYSVVRCSFPWHPKSEWRFVGFFPGIVLDHCCCCLEVTFLDKWLSDKGWLSECGLLWSNMTVLLQCFMFLRVHVLLAWTIPEGWVRKSLESESILQRWGHLYHDKWGKELQSCSVYPWLI